MPESANELVVVLKSESVLSVLLEELLFVLELELVDEDLFEVVVPVVLFVLDVVLYELVNDEVEEPLLVVEVPDVELVVEVLLTIVKSIDSLPSGIS